MVCIGANEGRAGRFFFLVAIAFFGSISTVFAQHPTQTQAAPQAERISKSTLTYQVTGGEAGYGYDIYSDGTLLIHQPGIPGIEGTAGFRKKEDSMKVAELVIRKLKNREMPPAVTREELKKLKVIN